MGEPRVIKRYANRKLYDTERSRYITLEQITEMIQMGEDVKIIDNTTKEDLTSVTLAQIIYEEEKRQKSFLPLGAMKNIIQSGGERFEELVSTAQKRMTGVFSRKAEGQGGASDSEPEPAEPIEESADVQKEGARALREFRDWIDGRQRMIDDWQKKVDERVRGMVEGLSPFASVQKDVAALCGRVEALEKKLESLLERS